ncbi:glycosyltransferase involved in cell wall biosynthesis [Janthinobacterium sp. CG_23.3]|uniref:glycosyltransferase family 4 protein n=1 Tax=unclassified Janthinobacterium TaxID=2610881 RepID=UPI0003479376|nr:MULTISPECIES: glycosyltransferase family 4 protein [unclassified Janthinobacterium]MEC5161184.1 glycosyltransferase involved in cell wall biosynthesis [Janthinobacterium sp. CG_S6]
MTPADTPGPGRKRRAVVCGDGIGIFPPLMQLFRDEFDIVAALHPRLPPWYAWWHRLASARWPRQAWYRQWRYRLEKTPAAFRRLSRDCARQLDALEGRYDVVLFFGAMHSPGACPGKHLFVFSDSCRWLSSRNAHDDISHFRDHRDEAEWLALEGEVYRSAARIFVGSDFVRDALLAHYDVAPGQAVTSGFGAGNAFGEAYEKVFDGKTILYIGKGDFEKKGGVVLLEAFAKVRRELPRTQLHIVGQERLPAAAGVVNHGFVRERERLVALMRAAHVFALPSLVDRNPISLLDAMAAATPCVASDYGAMPGMLGDAGIIAPCNDVDALAAALFKLLTNQRLARALGERGRRRFQERYNWHSVWQVIQREMREALA